MNRALVSFVTVAAIGVVASAPLPAQTPITFAFGATASDTGSAIVTGGTRSVPVRYDFASAATYFYSFGYALTALHLTVHFDPARIAVTDVHSNVSGATVTGTPGAGTYAVDASFNVNAGYGIYGYEAVPFQFTVQLLPGAPDGAYLWIEAGAATACYQSYYYYNCTGSYQLTAMGRPGQVCHATSVWGDVDGNGEVDSRDALITLSAAVGIPVSGFDLARGDVDGDGLTNSRDALMMLSYAVGQGGTGQTGVNRAGLGLVDACPGLTPPGETVVFTRNLGGGTGGIFRLDAAVTAPVQVTTVVTDKWPRLNAAGSAIVFQCDSLTDWQVCTTGADGSNRLSLLSGNLPYANPTFGTQPDWSPNGNYILYDTRGGFGIGRMDANGANKIFFGGSGNFGCCIAWGRNDSTYAWSTPNHYGILTAKIGEANLTYLDANYGLITYDAPMRWSPDGTVIAAINHNNLVGGILTLPATGGTSLPASAPPGIRAFDWGPQGIIFSMPDYHGVPSLWLLQGGFGGPLVRLTNPGAGQADDQPSFRRNP